MLSGAEEVVFSQHELNSKNLSLYLRFYSTGKVRLGYYSNDLDTMQDWSKKERGIISPSAPITVKRHELSMWMVKSPKRTCGWEISGVRKGIPLLVVGIASIKGGEKLLRCIWGQGMKSEFGIEPYHQARSNSVWEQKCQLKLKANWLTCGAKSNVPLFKVICYSSGYWMISKINC